MASLSLSTFIEKFQQMKKTLGKMQRFRSCYTEPENSFHRSENVIGFPFMELSSVTDLRKQSFSHWGMSDGIEVKDLVDAGFFCCNIKDRVLCIYCDLILANWSHNVNDLFEIHKNKSPKCLYVAAHDEKISHMLLHLKEANKHIPTMIYSNLYLGCVTPIDVYKYPAYSDIINRSCTLVSLPRAQIKVAKAGFFADKTCTNLICFFCGVTLDIMTMDENLIMKHITKSPDCGYIKQLCSKNTYLRFRCKIESS